MIYGHQNCPGCLVYLAQRESKCKKKGSLVRPLPCSSPLVGSPLGPLHLSEKSFLPPLNCTCAARLRESNAGEFTSKTYLQLSDHMSKLLMLGLLTLFFKGNLFHPRLGYLFKQAHQFLIKYIQRNAGVGCLQNKETMDYQT